MIKPEMMPKKVVRASQKAWEKDTESFRPTAKTIAAALNAWPGMEIERDTPWNKPRTLHLPLPEQENSDE